jgi:preprotein translocase subunit YajC
MFIQGLPGWSDSPVETDHLNSNRLLEHGKKPMSTWNCFADASLLGQQPPNMYSMLLPIVAIGFLFYFLIVRPEKRKQSAIARMQSELKKNDRVVTVGGIIGTVVNTQQGSNEVTIRVDDSTNTRLHMLRSSISRVLTDDKSNADEGAK